MGNSFNGEDGLVSIITPCYNSGRFIAEMIESVLDQDYTDWELLITDDCSTDNSVDIIKSYACNDPRIKLFKLEKNSGAGIARNKSIEMAKGRYIAFCDSDDLWRKDKLSKQLDFISEGCREFVFCQAVIIDTEGKTVGINHRKPVVTYASTKRVNYIGTSGVMYDTRRIGKVFMKPIRRRQDWVLWMDILKETGKAYCQPEPLGIVRTNNSESLSGKKWKLPQYHIEVYNKYLGYPKAFAFLYFYFASLPCFIIKKIKGRIENRKYLSSLQNIDN